MTSEINKTTYKVSYETVKDGLVEMKGTDLYDMVKQFEKVNQDDELINVLACLRGKLYHFGGCGGCACESVTSQECTYDIRKGGCQVQDFANEYTLVEGDSLVERNDKVLDIHDLYQVLFDESLLEIELVD